LISTAFALQAGLFLNSVPGWLAPALVLIGIELVLIRYIEQSVNVVARRPEIDDNSSTGMTALPHRDYQLLIGGLTLGILFSAIAVIQRFQISNLYAMLLLFCGRAIEGVVAVRFYKKVVRFLRTRQLSGDLAKRVRHKLTMLFIIVVGVYLLGYALLRGPFLRSLGYTIQFVWTVTTLFLTAFGLRWKLRPVQDRFDRKVILGVILFVTGAELFNYTFLGELAATVVGSLGYTVGFWFAAALLIHDQGEPVAMRLKRVI